MANSPIIEMAKLLCESPIFSVICIYGTFVKKENSKNLPYVLDDSLSFFSSNYLEMPPLAEALSAYYLSGNHFWGQFRGLKKNFRPLFRGLHDINDCEKLKPKIEQATRRATGYKNKRFTFLNHEHTFDGSIDWNTLDVSQLWRYHLHYFDIVQDLLLVSASGQQDSAWRTFKELADSWIDSNPLGNGDGWHPYTISLRLVNWIQRSV